MMGLGAAEQPVSMPNDQKQPKKKRRRQPARSAYGGFMGRLSPLQPHGRRECNRRVQQGAHYLQQWSHKPGTVQPSHIFGAV